MGIKAAWRALWNEKAAIRNPFPQSALIKMGVANYGRDNQEQNIEKYATLDDIYSVIRLIAKTASMLPIRVYKVKDERKFREYTAQTKAQIYTTTALVKQMFLKAQALEEVPQNDELQMLLDNPNTIYSKAEFYEGFYTFRLATGNGYIYAPKLELGVNAGKVGEMFLLPSQYVAPKITNSYPRYITGYELNLFGIKDLPKDDVLHSRYFNPRFTSMGDELIGFSPLSALHRTSARAKAENEFMVRGFQNAGAQGIVNFEDTDPTADGAIETLGKMKSDYYSESSGVYQARKSLFHAGKTSFTQIGLGPVDMQVIESQKITFKKICNVYGISDILFNNGEASTESNVQEMVKRLYTNAALPEAYALRDLLNNTIAKAYPGYYIDVDITGVTELQDDFKQLADIFSTLPVMQPNMILEAFKYGKSTDPLMDKFYIKSGYDMLENLQAVPDLPLSNDYGQQP